MVVTMNEGRIVELTNLEAGIGGDAELYEKVLLAHFAHTYTNKNRNSKIGSRTTHKISVPLVYLQMNDSNEYDMKVLRD